MRRLLLSSFLSKVVLRPDFFGFGFVLILLFVCLRCLCANFASRSPLAASL